ncbi:fimbrial protein [Klebsiella oxytoca]|uniref:fimbrial protein n=1 Tax=Klebsiella oxytoca TaxID=571 RepID=UPI0034D1FF94
MLKALIALMITFPAFVFAADPPNVVSKQITVTGSVYRVCTVDTGGNGLSLDLGNHRADRWVSGNNYLAPASGTVPIEITLSDCDADTKVRVTFEGIYVSGNKWFLANLNTEASELLASLQIYRNASSDWKTLPMDKSEYVEIDASGEQKIQLRGMFRRLDNNVNPVGLFKATPTMIFTFQ